MNEPLICSEINVFESKLTQRFDSVQAPFVLHQRVGVPVAHEDWDILVLLVGGIHIRGKLIVEEQVGGQAEYASEGLRGGNAGEEGDSAALGKPAEDDAGRGYALVYLFFYEGVEVVAGSEDAGLIVGLGEFVEGCLVDKGVSDLWEVVGGTDGFARSYNVIPAWHLHAEILGVAVIR